jgi:hypothetical protein
MVLDSWFYRLDFIIVDGFDMILGVVYACERNEKLLMKILEGQQ